MFTHRMTFETDNALNHAQYRILPKLALSIKSVELDGTTIEFQTEQRLGEDKTQALKDISGVGYTIFNIDDQAAHFNIWQLAGDSMRIVDTMTTWRERANERAFDLTNRTRKYHVAVLEHSVYDRSLIAEMHRKSNRQSRHEEN